MSSSSSSIVDPEASARLGEDRSSVLVGISIAFAVLTTVALALRIWAKRFQGGRFYIDDVLLLAAYVINLGMCADGILITKLGAVGRHIEFVETFEPAKLGGWAMCLFAFEIIYFTSIALPKLAIICLYLRIFEWRGMMRTVAWVLFTLTALTSVSLVVAACFQCIPIQFFWDRTIPGGKCFDIQAFFHAQAIPGFLLDLMIMALPVDTILKLKLPLIKRLALVFVFIIASFGIVASVIRARIFFKTDAFTDETMASVDLIGWSIIETSVYIITNCLPHFRPLIAHYTPASVKKALKNMGSSLGGATSHYNRSHKGGYGYGGASGAMNSKVPSSSLTTGQRDEEDMIALTEQKSWPVGRDDVRSLDGERVGMPKAVSPGIRVTREVRLTRE